MMVVIVRCCCFLFLISIISKKLELKRVRVCVCVYVCVSMKRTAHCIFSRKENKIKHTQKIDISHHYEIKTKKIKLPHRMRI